MDKVPAERVIRHLYHPETGTWSVDHTIVKMEKEPFTHGAMRTCYRMKKRSPPPKSSSNHRFHSGGWVLASNYIAKAYHKNDEIDTSEEAKAAVRNDIILQYEASHWAQRFNEQNIPKQIVFIRAYVIELPDRPGAPWFAVERFIDGADSYGCGFTKHNTNNGFVDEELHRVTPQVFSAHSFYSSEGTRLIADIQGVGDLYTDPQVLSKDYRFGDGDLGTRGMALFFKTFRHNSLADSMGIPVFPLSKNEIKHQTKYEDDVFSVSDTSSSKETPGALDNKFARLDLNRNRRVSVFLTPLDCIKPVPAELQHTDKRSNTTPREDVGRSIRKSIRLPKPTHNRNASEVEEVKMCIERAKEDFRFDHTTFHRKESGELAYKISNQPNKRSSLIIRTVSEPMVPTDETKSNLGRVHYQLAVLHGMGRFPEVVPLKDGETAADAPLHDVFSVLFHLSHAAALNNVPACLALGRVLAGLETVVSDLIGTITPLDFDVAMDLLRRAMDSPYPPAGPKAAAGCLLYQILLDGGDNSANTMINLLEETITQLESKEVEEKESKEHKKRADCRRSRFAVGDIVEANYFLEGTFYTGVVEAVSADGNEVVVKYDDDGTSESLTLENVRLVVLPTVTQTALGGPLSDEEAFGEDNGDEKCLMEAYELKAELAELYEKQGNGTAAAELFEEAADGAMTAGKPKKATEWSLKASELAS
jgi:elongation factor 2 kinase